MSSDLQYSVGIDPTALETGANAIDARLEASGVRMSEIPQRFAKSSAEAFLAAEKAQNEWAQMQIQQAQQDEARTRKKAADSAAAFQEAFAREEALAAKQKQEADALLSAQAKLAAYTEQTAYSRMGTEEKLSVIRGQAVKLQEQIAAIEGQTAEKAALQLQYEQKKATIYELNQQLKKQELTLQQESEAAAAREQAALEKKKSSLGDIATLMTAGILADYAKRLLDNADAIQHMSENLDVSAERIQSFQYAVRASNGTNEDANRIFTTVREKLDDLRASVPAVAEKFGQLGLSASDFVGLSLDQALEKIAAAYVANKDQAGAYSAMQDLVGKSGKNLTDVLSDLGVRGFGSLVDSARAANAVISDETIKSLADAKRAFEEMQNTLTIGGSEILGVVSRVMESIGQLAGAAVGKIESATGAWEKMRAVLSVIAALSNPTAATLLVAEQASARIASSSEAIAAAQQTQARSGREIQDIQRLRAEFERIILQGQLEQLDTVGKIKRLKEEMAQHAAAAAAAGIDEVKMQTEMNAQAKAAIEIVRLEAQLKKEVAAAAAKLLITTGGQLPAEQTVTDELKNQNAELDKQRRKKAALAATQTISGGPDYYSMSTDALKGEAQKQRDYIFEQLASPDNFSHVSGSLRDQNIANAQSALDAITQELNLRSQVARVAGTSGESAARQLYGDTITNRALQDLSDSSTRQATAVEQINDRLRRLFE